MSLPLSPHESQHKRSNRFQFSWSLNENASWTRQQLDSQHHFQRTRLDDAALHAPVELPPLAADEATSSSSFLEKESDASVPIVSSSPLPTSEQVSSSLGLVVDEKGKDSPGFDYVLPDSLLPQKKKKCLQSSKNPHGTEEEEQPEKHAQEDETVDAPLCEEEWLSTEAETASNTVNHDCDSVTLDNVEEVLCHSHQQQPRGGVEDGEEDNDSSSGRSSSAVSLMPLVPLDKLFIKSSFTHKYRCPPVEKFFAVQTLPVSQRSEYSMLLMLVAIGNLSDAFFFSSDEQPYWTRMVKAVVGCLSMVAGIVNIILTHYAAKNRAKLKERKKRSQERQGRSDSGATTVVGQTLAQDFQLLRVYEVLAVGLIVMLNMTCLTAYPQAAFQCQRMWDTEQAAAAAASALTSGTLNSSTGGVAISNSTVKVVVFTEYCEQSVHGVVLFAPVVPLLLLEVRLIVSGPVVLLGLPLHFMGRWIAAWSHGQFLDTHTDFVLTRSILTLVTIIMIGALFSQSRDRRKRFETWVLLQRSTAQCRKQRRIVSQTLSNLIPPALIAKMDVGLAPFDTSECSTIGITQIFDYVPWSATLMPAQVVDVVDLLFVTFDNYVSSRFRLVKVKTVGDRYISCSDLMEEEDRVESRGEAADTEASSAASKGRRKDPGNPTPALEQKADGPRRVLLFCIWADAFSQYLCGGLGREAFKLSSGIHVGPCCGGIIGSRSLWCDLFGEAFDGARLVVSRTPAGAIGLSTRAVEAINGSSVEIPAALPAKDEAGNLVLQEGSGRTSTYFRFEHRSHELNVATLACNIDPDNSVSTQLKEYRVFWKEQYLFRGITPGNKETSRPEGFHRGLNTQFKSSTTTDEASESVDSSGIVAPSVNQAEEEQRTDFDQQDLELRRHQMLRQRIQAAHRRDLVARGTGHMDVDDEEERAQEGIDTHSFFKCDDWSPDFFFGFESALTVEESLSAPFKDATFCRKNFLLSFPDRHIEAGFLRFLMTTKSETRAHVAFFALNLLLFVLQLYHAAPHARTTPLLVVHAVFVLLLSLWTIIVLLLQYCHRKTHPEQQQATAKVTWNYRRVETTFICLAYLSPIPLIALGESSMLTTDFLYLLIGLSVLADSHLRLSYGYVRFLLALILMVEAVGFALMSKKEHGDLDSLIDASFSTGALIYGTYVAFSSFAAEKRWRQSFHDTALSAVFHEAAENELGVVKGMLNLLIPKPLIPFALAKVQNTGDGHVCSLGEVCVGQIRFEAPIALPGGDGVLQSMEKLEALYGTLENCLEQVNQVYGGALWEKAGDQRKGTAVPSSSPGNDSRNQKRPRRRNSESDGQEEPLLEKVSTIGDYVLIAGPIQTQPTLILSDSVNVAMTQNQRRHRKAASEKVPPLETGSSANVDEDDPFISIGSPGALSYEWMEVPQVYRALAKDPTLRGAAALADILALLQHLDDGLPSSASGRTSLSAVLHVEAAFASFLGVRQPSFTLLGPSIRTAEVALHAAPPELRCMTGAFRRLLCNGHIKFPRHPDDFTVSPEPHRWGLRGVGLLEIYTLK